MNNYWFKCWGSRILRGTLHDENLKVKGAWLCILSLLSERNSQDGKIEAAKGKGYSDSWFAEEFGCSRQEWIYCKNRLQKIGCIKILKNNEIFVKNWEKYQEKNEMIAEPEAPIDSHFEEPLKSRVGKKQTPYSEKSPVGGEVFGGSTDGLPTVGGSKTEEAKKRFSRIDADKTPSIDKIRIREELDKNKILGENKISENPLSKSSSKNKEEKIKYAEFVSMTEKEYQSLADRLGSEERVRRGIEILNAYKGAHGRRYRSDYLAFLSWVEERLKEEEMKNQEKVPRGIAGLREFMEEAKKEERNGN